MPKYLVETVSMHKIQYLIECEEEEHALDVVTCQDDGLQSFHQEHISESIFSVWSLSEDEVDNIIASSDNAHMGRKMIYKVDYSA